MPRLLKEVRNRQTEMGRIVGHVCDSHAGVAASFEQERYCADFERCPGRSGNARLDRLEANRELIEAGISRTATTAIRTSIVTETRSVIANKIHRKSGIILKDTISIFI